MSTSLTCASSLRKCLRAPVPDCGNARNYIDTFYSITANLNPISRCYFSSSAAFLYTETSWKKLCKVLLLKSCSHLVIIMWLSTISSNSWIVHSVTTLLFAMHDSCTAYTVAKHCRVTMKIRAHTYACMSNSSFETESLQCQKWPSHEAVCTPDMANPEMKCPLLSRASYSGCLICSDRISGPLLLLHWESSVKKRHFSIDLLDEVWLYHSEFRDI